MPLIQIPALLAAIGAFASGKPFFHPDTSLVFPVPGAVVPSEVAKAYPIQATSMDSFDLKILAATPDTFSTDKPTFTPLASWRIRKPSRAGACWTHRIDLDSVSRSLGGAYLELRATIPNEWVSRKPEPELPPSDPSTMYVLHDDTSQPMAAHYLEIRKALQVEGPLVIVTSLESHQHRISVFDRTSGKPLVGAQVFMPPQTPPHLARATDSSGNLNVPLSAGTQVLVRQGPRFTRMRIGTPPERSGTSFDRLYGTQWDEIPTDRILPEPPAPPTKIVVPIARPFLHQTLYRPGDSVVVGCLVHSGFHGTVPLELSIEPPYGANTPKASKSFEAKTLDHLQWRWRIPDSAPPGDWKVVSRLENSWREFPFVVENPRANPGSASLTSLSRGLCRFPGLQLRTLAPDSSMKTDSVRWRIRFREDVSANTSPFVQDNRFCRNYRILVPDRNPFGFDTTFRTPLAPDGKTSTQVDPTDAQFFWRTGTLRAQATLESPFGRGVSEVLVQQALSFGREPRLHFQAIGAQVRITAVVVDFQGLAQDGIPLRLQVSSPLLKVGQLDTNLLSGTTVELALRERLPPSDAALTHADLSAELTVRGTPGTGVRSQLPLQHDPDTDTWKIYDPLPASWASQTLAKPPSAAPKPSRFTATTTTSASGPGKPPQAQDELTPGDTLLASWEAQSPSLALVQVIGPNHILVHRAVVSRVGANRLPLVVGPHWKGFVDLVVHRYDPSLAGPDGDALATWRKRFHVGRPREARPTLRVSPLAGFPDSLRAVLSLPARVAGKVSWFWTTSGADSLEFSDLPSSEEFDPTEPAVQVSWWSQGSRLAEFRHSRFGEGGFHRSNSKNDQEAGWWEFEFDRPYPRRQESSSTEPRRASIGSAPGRTWVGASIPLDSDSLVVHLGIPEGTARLRVGVTGMAGSTLVAQDTVVAVVHREPVAMDLPRELAMTDTAMVRIRFPRALHGRTATLSLRGPVEILGSRQGNWSFPIARDGFHTANLHALGEGTASVELFVDGSLVPGVGSQIRIPAKPARTSSLSRLLESRLVQKLSFSMHPLRLDSTRLRVTTTDAERARDLLRSRLLQSLWNGEGSTLADSWKALYLDTLFPGRPRDSVVARQKRLLALVKEAMDAAYIFQAYDSDRNAPGGIWSMLSNYAFLQDARALGFGISERSLPDLDSAFRMLPEKDLPPIAHALFLTISAKARDSARLERLGQNPSGATACHLVSQAWSRLGFGERGIAQARNCPPFSSEILPWGNSSGERMQAHAIQAWAALGSGLASQAQPALESLCEGLADSDDFRGVWPLRTLLRARETCGPPSARSRVQWRTDSGAWRALELVRGTGSVKLPRGTTGVEIKWSGSESRRLQADLVGHGLFEPEANGLAKDIELAWSVEDKTGPFPDTLHLDDDLQLAVRIRNRTRRTQGGRLTLEVPGGWTFPQDHIRFVDSETPQAGSVNKEARTHSVKEWFRVDAFHSSEHRFSLRATHPGVFHGGVLRLQSAEDSDVLAEIPFPRTVVVPARRPLEREAKP
ncbi:MAG: hypothetical protein IPN71_14800 [Fibrobacteres bacterium]|nr:hypothetical protein [Fibrobacterota bacterium]